MHLTQQFNPVVKLNKIDFKVQKKLLSCVAVDILNVSLPLMLLLLENGEIRMSSHFQFFSISPKLFYLLIADKKFT